MLKADTLGKLAPEDLASHAAAVAAMLKHFSCSNTCKDSDVRKAAADTLGKLAPKDLVAHAAALAAKLEDSNED
eukprot:2791255-Prymnesium_polylepis.1